MLRGEPVTVLVPAYTHDAAKNEVVEWGPTDGDTVGIAVDNVLFGRPTTERMEEVARYHGATVAYVLGFPKGFETDLRGCKVVRGLDQSEWLVIGEPHPLPEELCPTPWNMEVEVEAVHG